MQYLEIASRDPAFNLALEEQLFRTLPENHPGYFLLWQNDPAIIIGRHQCAAEVVNASFVADNNLPVIRRITGGGAVYHDAGNLNFSFIRNGARRLDFTEYLRPICGALASLGIAASISGRNDLEIGGKKFSGSGQLVERGKILHHGTILFDMNLERMALALKVDDAKFRSKGVASIKARVMNLAAIPDIKISLRDLKKTLASHCASGAGKPDSDIVAAARDLARKKYSSWEWNFGQSPACNLERKKRFPWGEVGVYLQIRKGRIDACALRGDFFNLVPVEQLENRLANMPFYPESVAAALSDINWEDYFCGCEPEAMREFFVAGLFA